MESEIKDIVKAGGKALVEKVIKKVLKRSSGIDKTLDDNFYVRGREMVIRCPEAIQRYSVTFESKGGSILSRKMKFKYGNVKRVSLRAVRSLENLSDAIKISKDGFELSLRRLTAEELYILDTEYKIGDPHFIESLVRRDVAHETPTDECIEYWIVAQLKHLKTLKQDFGSIALRDLDFGVDVGVHQDIDMKVPFRFKQQIETIVKLLRRTGRGEKFKLYTRLLQLQQLKYAGREFELLRELQDLFLPIEFCRFVEVVKDFYYYNCERGTDFYETLPFPTWPKTMRIVTRTDLDFERPAANGILTFKRKEFRKIIEELFD